MHDDSKRDVTVHNLAQILNCLNQFAHFWQLLRLYINKDYLLSHLLTYFTSCLQTSLILHRVPKKEATNLLAITFSNLNWLIFKILSLLKRGRIFPKKLLNIFHHTLSMFLHYLGKVNSSNLLQITTEKSKSVFTQFCNRCVLSLEWKAEW